jgi:uroporphyrinogen decarboxylase
MKMNMYEWVDSLNHCGPKKSLPVLTFPSVQLMDVSVRELISDSKLQAKGMMAIADRVDALGCVSYMDLSVEAEAFGAKIQVFDAEVPTVIDALVTNREEAEALKVPDVYSGRTKCYIEAITEVGKQITDKPVFAGMIGPYSLAGRLVDVSQAMIYCMKDPETIKIVLDKATDFLIAYAKEYKKTGINGIVMAEPLSGLLSPKLEAKFSAPYVKKIVDAVQDENFIIIYHNCGNATVKMVDSISNNGCKVFHFGNAINMKDMLEKFPSDKIVMGNISPAEQFYSGTPESMREAVLSLLEECSGYPNFVISSGCDIPPMSKWENIDAYFAAIEEFYAKH